MGMVGDGGRMWMVAMAAAFMVVGCKAADRPEAAAVTVTPPRVISTSPANGAQGVDVATTQIEVRFDQPMDVRGFSVTDLETATPLPMAGRPQFSADGRSFVLPVRLAAGQRYGYSINNQRYRNFRSAGGIPVEPYAVTFSTAAR